jgi:hypothetical protein
VKLDNIHFVFKVSLSGRSTATIELRRLNEPTSKFMRTPNSSAGARVVMLIAPPLVLRPNKVPCGPRSTSTRSTSAKFDSRKPYEVCQMPSM